MNKRKFGYGEGNAQGAPIKRYRPATMTVVVMPGDSRKAGDRKTVVPLRTHRPCTELPVELWVKIFSYRNSFDDLDVCTVVAWNGVNKAIHEVTNKAFKSVLGQMRWFVSKWQGLSRNNRGQIYGTALDFFWDDVFKDAGALGSERWMEWLPSPLDFVTMYDCTICEEALKREKFEFLKWTKKKGYRFSLAFHYQRIFYALKDGKVQPFDIARETRMLSWLLENKGDYNLTGDSQRLNFPNLLRVNLQYQWFYPISQVVEGTVRYREHGDGLKYKYYQG
jgi:hypothetical protein